jgi:hypothetical protein
MIQAIGPWLIILLLLITLIIIQFFFWCICYGKRKGSIELKI